jgi:hypothetical protein
MTPQQFIAKWKPVALAERAAAQAHFLDFCALLGPDIRSLPIPWASGSRSKKA